MVHVVFEGDKGERLLVASRPIFVRGSATPHDTEESAYLHLEQLPPCDGHFACLDHPVTDTELRFNPFAAEWQEFRKHQVQALLSKFADLALKAGIPPGKIYSHQTVPNFEGTWNRVAFAVPEPQAGNAFLPGVDLYGGAVVYRGLRDYLGQSGYAVPEFHPRMGKVSSHEIFLRALEYHRDLGADFICPYFMALREPFGQYLASDLDSKQDAMMIHPMNVGLGSMFFYTAIVKFLGSGRGVTSQSAEGQDLRVPVPAR